VTDERPKKKMVSCCGHKTLAEAQAAAAADKENEKEKEVPAGNYLAIIMALLGYKKEGGE